MSPCDSKRTLKRSPKPLLSTMDSRTSSSTGITSGASASLPDSIFSMSRMSLIRSSRRWPLRSATVVSSPISLSTSPITPLLMSCSEPMIEVSGVRSSWLSVEVNSFFMRSASSWAVTSRPCAMTAITSRLELTSGVTVHSQISSTPSRRGLRILSPATDSRAVDELPPGAVELGVEFRHAPASSAVRRPARRRRSRTGSRRRGSPRPPCRPGCSSSTAIGARSANRASLRPLASTWRRASSSSTSCLSRRRFSRRWSSVSLP